MSKAKLSEKRREARKNSPDAKVVKIRTEGRGLGAYKTAFVAIFILAQLAVLLLALTGAATMIKWYQVVAFTFSLIAAVHAVSSNMDGHTKAIWVLCLLTFSSFAWIFYILSSERIFFGWARRRYKRIFSRTEKYSGEYFASENASQEVLADTKFLWNSGKFKAYNNSKLKYYPSGAQMYDDVLEDIKSAEKFVFIEFFIITDGILLDKFYNILSEKAKNGVDVRIICDGMGSHGTLSFKARKKFKRAGIKLLRFNPVIPFFTFALNLRDHRKIIAVDGKCAYAGGCNLADEYINEKRMHGYWKDAGIKVEGEAVNGLTLQFLRQWEFVNKQEEDYSKYLIAEKTDGADTVIPYADGKDYKKNISKGVYSNLMSGAKQKLYIMTPYFVPDEETFDLLTEKAVSGVDVRIILPEVPDKPYVYRVSIDNAERLLSAGVKVYKMHCAFVHSKVMYTENCCVVSSANIDLRSYYNQFENGVYTDDCSTMSAVKKDFDNTLKVCVEVTKEKATRNKLFPRILAGFLRLFAPMM